VKKTTFPAWMQTALDLNPGYGGWGPGEDAMKAGETVPVTELWELDALNECVNFRFAILQAHDDCVCKGTGLNAAARTLDTTFYHGWGDNLTDDEMAALIAEKRPTIPFGGYHDAISCFVLVRARHARLHGSTRIECDACDGEGAVPRPGSRARLAMHAWILHPRKGASVCLTVDPIHETELPTVLTWLATAAERNAARFARAVACAGAPRLYSTAAEPVSEPANEVPRV